MKGLALLAAFLAVAGAINPTALYRSRCSEGASYWCETATQANECGAVEYCIQNFWTGKAVQESATCTDCEAFVNGVHNVMEQTTVQEEILAGAKLACTVMGPLASTCELVVETVGPEVLQKLVTELTADEVCHVLGFCKTSKTLVHVNDNEVCTLCQELMSEVNALVSNVTIQQEVENTILLLCPFLESIIPNCAQVVQDDFPVVVQLLLQYLNPETCTEIGLCSSNAAVQQIYQKIINLKNGVGDQLCDDCRSTLSDIDVLLNSSAFQGALILELDQLCYTLGVVAPLCKYYVGQYTGQVLRTIMSTLNPNLCSTIGFCQSTRSRPQMTTPVRSPGGDMCSDCEAFVQDIDGMLMNATVQNMITTELDTLCEQLGSFADQCKSYVDQYGVLVLDLLASELNPQQICQGIGFCSSMKLVDLLRPRLTTPVRIPGDALCSDCEAFFQDIDGMLMNTTVQNMVIADLDTLCEQLGSFAAQCKSYVDQYGVLVFDFLASELNAQQACQAIGFCPSLKLLQTVPKPQPKVQIGADMCTDCKTFFADIVGMLQNQTVQNIIEQNLDVLCSQLGSFADQCKSYVDQYGVLVFDFLASGLAPDAVCADIGFCPSTLRSNIKRFRGPSKQCTDCGQFFTDVLTQLSDPTVQSEIVNAVENVCSLFGPNADMCRDYIDQYGGVVIQFIVASLDPSTICNDLGFCMSSLLKKQPFQLPSDSGVCALCETLATSVETYITSPATQAAILKELEAVCMELGSFADQCKLLVDQYTGPIIDIVISYLDPKTICTDIKLCPGNSVLKKFKADPKLCSDCKNFMTDVDTILSNQTLQNELVAELETLCSMAGSLEAECKLLIATYAPAVFQYLQTMLDPTTVCTEIGFCAADAAPVETPKRQLTLTAAKIRPMAALQAAVPIQHEAPKKVDFDGCSLCKTIVGLFEAELENNKTVEEILDAVSELCMILPTTVEAECTNMVHAYGELIIELIQQELTPEDICKTIGECTSKTLSLAKPMKALNLLLTKLPVADTPFCALCQFAVTELDSILSSNKSKEEITQEVEKLICANLPSPLNAQCDSFMGIYGDVLITLLIDQFDPTTFCAEVGLCDAKMEVPKVAVPLPEATTECIVCEFIVRELDSVLADNATEMEIQKALEEVCSKLPSSISSECTALVDEYSAEIIKYLVNGFTPEALCSAIGICESADMPEVKKVGVDADANCILCEYVMSELDKLLTENSTEAEIEAALEKVCSLLPATITAECDLFVSAYTPWLIAYLTNDLTPLQFCKDIGLCDTTIKVEAPTADPECAICELVVSELDRMLGDNKTQEEIKDALDEVCDVLPSSVRTDCENFVQTYEPLLIKYLVDEEPSQICTLFKLCQSSLKARLGSLECDLCQMAVREFMNALQEPSVTKEIVTIVNDTCAILPAELKVTCYTYVDQYGDLVTEFIAQFFDPITSCTLLDICPTPDNAPKKQLLGLHECTQGPGYWCASRENAQHCNMVEHCQRYVWN